MSAVATAAIRTDAAKMINVSRQDICSVASTKKPRLSGASRFGIRRRPGIESGCRAAEALAKMDGRVQRRHRLGAPLVVLATRCPENPSIEKKDRAKPCADKHWPGERFRNRFAFGGALGCPNDARRNDQREPISA
jgi:hypothetical protein